MLTPFSIMSVNLAAQVLSQSVANVLRNYYPDDTHATATFCENLDKCFDCANVRNQTEGITKRRENLMPFRDINDHRFEWLHSFLEYLKKWKESTVNLPGNFTRNARGHMFISAQTHKGLQITVHSLIETVKFLLKSGMPFVLTEKFNQDVSEEYFGRHRSLGRRNDNPTVHQFSYQSDTIRMNRSVVPVRGNTEGAHKKKRHVSWSLVDNEPLSKRVAGSSMI